jgi:hypothetical protein
MYGRGKEQGTRKVKAPTPQFDALQTAHLARIERELAQKQQEAAKKQAA